MPLIQLTTNRPLDDTDRDAFLAMLSTTVAKTLGKPEQYVMVNLTINRNMLFAGSAEPLAYVELKSLGLPEEDTKRFSAQLSDIISDRLGVPAARIYIEFSSPPRHMWGWNGATF